jgi:CHAD domain-containing protein
MFQTITPVDLLQQQIAVIRDHLPAVFDGNSRGVHDARIATRRVRAVLPLVEQVCPPIARDDDLADRIKQIGRALGSIRDLDARLDLLTFIDARLPGAGSALVAARHHQRVKRGKRMRKLVKRLEELDIERVLEHVAHVCSNARWRRSNSWRPHLHRSSDDRAAEAMTALAATTAVYFPSRTHKTRIAIKKFRYAAEIAAATGLPIGERCLRRLKKAQDALGGVHDRHVLLEELDEAAGDGRGAPANPQLDTIIQFVEAELNDQYRRFIERRDTLIGSVEEIRRAFTRSRLPALAWSTVAAAAAVAGVRALRRGEGGRAGPRVIDRRFKEADCDEDDPVALAGRRR